MSLLKEHCQSPAGWCHAWHWLNEKFSLCLSQNGILIDISRFLEAQNRLKRQSNNPCQILRFKKIHTTLLFQFLSLGPLVCPCALHLPHHQCSYTPYAMMSDYTPAFLFLTLPINTSIILPPFATRTLLVNSTSSAPATIFIVESTLRHAHLYRLSTSSLERNLHALILCIFIMG